VSSVPETVGDRVPVHQRSIVFDAFDAGEAMTIVGRLRDIRPWAEGTSAVSVVHDMELRVTVRTEDLTITDAVAVMHDFPHAECPGIVAAFGGLVGLSVTRGYTRHVQTLFGGARGCAHLEQLARSLGPVAIQSLMSQQSLVARRREDVGHIAVGIPLARDTCHVWADGGAADQKLAAGWRPGVGPYPAPALVTFRSTEEPR
jgi:hypothetical protein